MRKQQTFKLWMESAGYGINGPTLRDDDSVSWTFSPDDSKSTYEMIFERPQYYKPFWDIVFKVDGSVEMPHQKPENPMKVLNTRRKILEKFIEKYEPKKLTSMPIDDYREKLWMATFRRWGYKPQLSPAGEIVMNFDNVD